MTELEAHEVVKLLVRLWPQMDDMTPELTGLWIRALKPLDSDFVRDALQDRRSKQTKPIRPEIGELSIIVKAYQAKLGNYFNDKCTDIFIQAIDYGPEYEPYNGTFKRPLGEFHQLIYGTHLEVPGRRQQLEDAKKWANHHREQTGLVWAVFEGVDEEQMRKRRSKLMAGEPIA